ncbi:MAG TPA: acetate uptake transporter [Jatrophihabitantaceae bacterium]
MSVFNTGMIKTGSGVVLGLALAYGGIAQFAAGMWEFIKGNTFGAVAFASYGAFWVSAWWLLTHLPADAKGNDLAHGIGVYFLAWCIFTTYMFVASLRMSGAVAAVFVFLAATFHFLAIGALSMSTADIAAANYNGLYKFAGWLGLITALFAWYASFAAVTNSTFKRVVLPTYPLAGRH